MLLLLFDYNYRHSFIDLGLRAFLAVHSGLVHSGTAGCNRCSSGNQCGMPQAAQVAAKAFAAATDCDS